MQSPLATQSQYRTTTLSEMTTHSRDIESKAPYGAHNALRVLLAIVALLAFVLAAYAAWTSLYKTQIPVRLIQYRVAPGDTLWGIASEFAPNVDPGREEYAIMQANGMKHSAIYPGETLQIPVRGN